jgi:sporulation protein YabP
MSIERTESRVATAKNEPNRKTLQMMGRTELTVEGVNDVVRFEEDSVIMDTELGMLEVDGAELRILRLDPERKEVALAGTVNGLFYTDAPQKKRGFWRFGRS